MAIRKADGGGQHRSLQKAILKHVVDPVEVLLFPGISEVAAVNDGISHQDREDGEKQQNNLPFISPSLHARSVALMREKLRVPTQLILGLLRGTVGVLVVGWPTIKGATTWLSAGSPSSSLPSRVFNHPCANPIQQLPSWPSAAASIRFWAAKPQSSFAQIAPAGADITIRAGA